MSVKYHTIVPFRLETSPYVESTARERGGTAGKNYGEGLLKGGYAFVLLIFVQSS